MPTITWPSDVPKCFMLDNYTEEQQSVTVRSPVDTGPRKVRRRYTKAYIGVMANIVCDVAELARLRNFFDVTLQGGTQKFDLDHPYDGTVKTWRFLEPPIPTPLSVDHFRVQLMLEII